MAAPPFKVKAVYEYASEHDDDLSFPIGQVITVTELEGDEWYVGEYTDVTGEKHDGLFPANFVEKYEPEVPSRPVRPSRQKAEPAPAPIAASSMSAEPEEEEVAPVIPASSKPPPPAVEATPAPVTVERSASTRSVEPPPAPRPTPAEPAEPAATPAKKAPPPVAAKSNAFKDRIAAFNQGAAAPVVPFQPGKSQAPSNFIKKPFVAPPPSKNAYIPPPKVEPVHKPYVRDEDPEIKEREEEDRAAAEAVGLGTASSATAPAIAQEGEDEDAPKPMTLKERMALLQKQQQEQAQRRAEASSKKKPPPQKKASESSDVAVAHPEAEGEELERTSTEIPRRSTSTSQRAVEPPMSPVPAMPEHEILSDGHEADQSGAGDLSDDEGRSTPGPDRDDSDERAVEPVRPPIGFSREPPPVEEDRGISATPDDDEEEEEDEVDEETRRKEELRARMARLGGGMPGMGAPFNPFGAPPPALPKKKAPAREPSDEAAPASPPQAPIPAMVPVPGMQRMQSPESDATQRMSQNDVESDEGDAEPELPAPPKRAPTMERGAPPPVPKESRPVPPPPTIASAPRPPPVETRPVPPPPPAAVMSPGPGSESDDELSSAAKRSSAELSGIETPLPTRSAVPAAPTARAVPPRPPQSPDEKRASYLSGSEPSSATSEKRSSRVVPPIPGQASSPVTSPRPPPPPPPTQAPPSRRSTMDPAQDEDDDEDEEQVGSDYDGDYDTDIASSAKHKDALKAGHVREASLTDPMMGDDTPISSPPPPPPHTSAPVPRSVPPPPPPGQSVPLPKTRQSMDRAPPPVPAARDIPAEDEEYDPYRYQTEPTRSLPPAPAATMIPVSAPPLPPGRPEESSADDFAAPAGPPPRRSTDRAPPPPPQQPSMMTQDRSISQSMQPPPSSQPPTRVSNDVQRSNTTARRSIETGRPSGEQDQIASDIPLPRDSPWWTAAQPLPPALQERNGVDILSECEETTKSKRGGKTEVTKDIYVLYMDYSQTIISARYDSHEPNDVQLEQRHEPPPMRLRQDQLETAWQRFGRAVAEAAHSLGGSKKDSTVVGDGRPEALPLEIIKGQTNALLPVGSRAYGALVYANLANASTLQHDEIRRGDIITLRNARFEGHHGAMKSKYKVDYGTSHVGIVEEWDGTRRAVRAWEQGRDRKGGVRSEKFRLGDLKGGEVRVWRVVGREWVGWES